MAHRALTGVLDYVRSLVGTAQADSWNDALLLRRFAAQRDEAALVTLIQRHGPLVLPVCRQVLADPHAAEDAFQATFLIMAKKAASIYCRDSLSPWLHRVAYRAALKVSVAAARRQIHEQEAMAMKHATLDGESQPEWQPVLHEEVDRLPDKYRVPVVLCYLKGQTYEAVAQSLGWPLGTVKARLRQARDLLQRRLVRRGVTLAVAALTAAGSDGLAAVPPKLLEATSRAASDFAAGMPYRQRWPQSPRVSFKKCSGRG